MWTGIALHNTHILLSRVKDDDQYGYEALDRESILHGNAGWLGDYTELSILLDNIARFLYKYHAESYSSVGLLHTVFPNFIPLGTFMY